MNCRNLLLGLALALCACCQILNAATVHLFSVRSLHRGSDSYGFVQLPFVSDSEGHFLTDSIDSTVYALLGACHVPECRRPPPAASSAGGAGGGPITIPATRADGSEPDCCPHVAAAIRCLTVPETATPLDISPALVDALPMPEEARAQLGAWLKEEEGGSGGAGGSVPPTVQRVGPATVVVRCEAAGEGEEVKGGGLGFVHLSVVGGPNAKRPTPRPTYRCSCTPSMVRKPWLHRAEFCHRFLMK